MTAKPPPGAKWAKEQTIEILGQVAAKMHAPHSSYPDCEWMYGDCSEGAIGIHDLAGLNPLRWSGSRNLLKGIVELQDAQHKCRTSSGPKERPIIMKVPAGVLRKELNFHNFEEAIRHLQKIADLPEGVQVVETAKKVNDVIQELQNGRMSAADGFCVVHSEAEKKFCMVFRSDKQQEAYAKAKKELPFLKQLEFKTTDIILLLPGPAKKVLKEVSDGINLPMWKSFWVVISLLFTPLVAPRSILEIVVGFVYPALQTAIQMAQKPTEKSLPVFAKDFEFLTTYWMLFSFLNLRLVETILEQIPFFFYFKLAFFVWLYLPATKGAEIIADNVKKWIIPKLEAYMTTGKRTEAGKRA
jgi:hypothetical protein